MRILGDGLNHTGYFEILFEIPGFDVECLTERIVFTKIFLRRFTCEN